MGVLLSREHDLDAGRFDVPPWPPEPADLRWACDLSEWQPRAAEWEMLLGLLPASDREAVHAMGAALDRKRALVSRLMQRRAASFVLAVPDSDVVIRRTRAGKPFEAGESAAARAAHGAPNFNFNVAHDACLVVLAAVPRCRTHIPVCHRWRARSNRRYQAAASQSLACAAAHCAS